MDFLLRKVGDIHHFVWNTLPKKVAQFSSTLGYTFADGRYLLSFENITRFLPIIVFTFGLLAGGTNFLTGQPLFLSSILMLGIFTIICFVSGGLGMVSIAGYIIGYLLFYDHLPFHQGSSEDRHFARYFWQLYGTLGLNFFVFVLLPFVPMTARSLASMAADQLAPKLGKFRDIGHIIIQFVTEIMNAAIMMFIWVQTVLIVARSYYYWQNIGFGQWDIVPFTFAGFWGLHPLVWVAMGGVILRYIVEIICLYVKETPPLDLPKSFAFIENMPLTLKTLLGALVMIAILCGFIEQWSSIYILSGLVIGLYLLRDGIEVLLHKWFAMIELIPAAYRLPLIIFVNYSLSLYWIHYLEEWFGLMIFEAILGAVCISLLITFFFLSKNEPHRHNEPPTSPFWLKPLLKLFKLIKIPQSLRKKFVRTTPALLLITIIAVSFEALAHHCTSGCNCYAGDHEGAMMAGGLALLQSLMNGGGSGGGNQSVGVGFILKLLFKDAAKKEAKKAIKPKKTKPKPKKPKDSSKNEKHGDGGRAKTKVEKEIKDLEEKLKNAKTKREKKKIKQTIKNKKQNVEKKKKGEEHSRRPKK